MDLGTARGSDLGEGNLKVISSGPEMTEGGAGS